MGAAMAKKEHFSTQEIANFLWAFAVVGHVKEHLFSSFASTISSCIDNCTEQGIANVAWAYSVANVDSPELFNESFINASLEKENTFSVGELSQLHQWQLWQQELKQCLALPSALKDKCFSAFIAEAPWPSAFQDDVVKELKAIGLKTEEEVLTDNGYRLDAVVEVEQGEVGVEVDGPSHFIGKRPTGSTMLKRRQVPVLDGIEIVSVPYWEWGEMKRNGGMKQQYLRTLLGLEQCDE